MAIPVHLQQFKAAGIYRVVFDKSTISGINSEILRLVVGYSEQGPFNIPTYITSPSDFKAIYGDISKKLEKRGIYFHRLAIQALSKGPILALNLKKFDGETVDGASINTDFNPVFEPIDTVKINVEDIYDTTRFWELSAEKLNELRTANGQVMDQYINICTTNTKKTSNTYFIRKASGVKLTNYNISIGDWYGDGASELPDYLESYKSSLVSDFMAEIYVFKGRFSASQVLASNTLKNYFELLRDENGDTVLDENGQEILKLRDHMTNAFGDYVDTLDALYQDETSGALGYYMGSLIPYFKNKRGGYEALDVLFNSDQDVHNMMMSFNTDMLEEDSSAHIDISGRLSIPTDNDSDKCLTLDKLFNGTASTTLLGNKNAKVVTSKVKYTVNIIEKDVTGALKPITEFDADNARKVRGTLFVKSVDDVTNKITLGQVGDSKSTITIDCGDDENSANDLWVSALELGAAYKVNKAALATDQSVKEIVLPNKSTVCVKLHAEGHGTYWPSSDPAYLTDEGEFVLMGPLKVITAITRIDKTTANDYTDFDKNMKVTFEDVICVEESSEENSIYGASISFLPVSENWEIGVVNGAQALISNAVYDKSLFNSLQVGDCLLADDGSADRDEDGEADINDGFYDNVFVQETGIISDDFGNPTQYFIKLSGTPLEYSSEDANIYLTRIDAGINQEIGTITPQYLEGYVYKNSKPEGTSMYDKLQWQKFILSTLSEYKGLRTGLLNKSSIDYRYIVDTFETFVDEQAKVELSYLAKEKQSAFAILNFPSVKTFMKCPYTSFVDNNGVFNVEYVVKGYNKKKPAGIRFSLPDDNNGGSFCAFYSPLKFSDGYIDNIVPSAALVSNLFMEKYLSRQPYYIIAGPNYGRISSSGLIGPDYKYSVEELHVIEPFGVNCMVYRPGFGTFINANQTAKQSPVSALSKVNVRELVIYLQDEIERVLQSYQWEFNNARTRQAILDKANAICSRIAANGGIQAYMNIMDESNNGPEIIDNEMAVLSTHIEPGMGCGKMVHELTLYRTGQMMSSISE